MFDCLIIGDSIAHGLAQSRKDCGSFTVPGYNSYQWNRRFFSENLTATTVIISLGTNDHKGINTTQELKTLRQRIDADRVYWIMPPCNSAFCKPEINGIVEGIAKERGDYVINTKQLQRDQVHPNTAGQKELLAKIK